MYILSTDHRKLENLSMRDPQTHEEWQEAVDAAAFMVYLHSARLYGLIEGGRK